MKIKCIFAFNHKRKTVELSEEKERIYCMNNTPQKNIIKSGSVLSHTKVTTLIAW